MKYLIAMMAIWLMASCTSPIEGGDFCDLAEPLGTTNPDLARAIVAIDRPFAVDLNEHNELVKGCGK